MQIWFNEFFFVVEEPTSLNKLVSALKFHERVENLERKIYSTFTA